MKKIFAAFLAAGAIILTGYHAVMYYDNNFRYGRMRETPAVRPHEEPLLSMEEGIVPISNGEEMYRLSAGSDLIAPLNMNESATIARGKAVYFTYCGQCHGYHHDGNGTVGQSFFPLPTDLRSIQVQSEADGELFKTVSYGIPNGRQPALQTTITVADRWYVIAYVKSLGIR